MGNVITFGKHKGKSWERLVNENPTYILWCKKHLDSKYLTNLTEETYKAARYVYDKRNFVDVMGYRPYWNFYLKEYWLK